MKTPSPPPRASSATLYNALRRRSLLKVSKRPGELLRGRAARRLVHPCYRRLRPSDTGG